MGFLNRFKHAWDVFRNKDPTRYYSTDLGIGRGDNITIARPVYGNESTIIASIYNKIAIDCAAIELRHVYIDENDRYLGDVDSNINDCLTVSPNLDQTPRGFVQSAVLNMFNYGAIAIFPASGSTNLDDSLNYQVESFRSGEIVEWYPKYVRVNAYNPEKGDSQEIVLEKEKTAIVINPFYSVMNAPNSTLQRLVQKLSLLDTIDQRNGSEKLDLIIQLPYSIQNEIKEKHVEKRKQDIENQLVNSKFGIAYLGATEKVTQLNRPVENNLLAQIEYFNNLLYSQLGMTANIFNGTASEEEQLNYINGTVEPIMAAFADEMKRKFLTKTARTRGQTIMYFRDPFKLVPVSQIAEVADKFTRNEILTSNEVRGIMGFKPSQDPKADELRNSNISAAKQENEEFIAPDYGTDDGLPQE